MERQTESPPSNYYIGGSTCMTSMYRVYTDCFGCCRIHELKGTHENVFTMEFQDKVDLLKDVGALPNHMEKSADKHSNAMSDSTNYLDGKVSPVGASYMDGEVSPSGASNMNLDEESSPPGASRL